MRGRLGAGVSLLLMLASNSVGQALAPPQPAESRYRLPPARVGPAINATNPVADSVSTLGNPLPTPLGLGSPGSGVYSANVFAPGMNVQIPQSAAGTGARMFVVPNNDGGQTAILYNPGTGAVVEYNQTMNVSRLGQGPRYGQTPVAYFDPGVGTQMGIFGGPINVTTDPATGGFIGMNAGIPAINAARPLYNYKANAPQNFGSVPGAIGAGGGFGASAGAGVSDAINVSSPIP
jgi:hypothetical protein